MTVGVAVGPTSDLAVVRTSCLRKPTFEKVKPLRIIKAWICLRVLTVVTAMPTLFLIMLPIAAKHYLFFITDCGTKNEDAGKRFSNNENQS